MGILARRNAVGQECPTYMVDFDNAREIRGITASGCFTRVKLRFVVVWLLQLEAGRLSKRRSSVSPECVRDQLHRSG